MDKKFVDSLGLQGELRAAHKDDECVRKRLKILEDEKVSLRHRYFENEDELNQKYGNIHYDLFIKGIFFFFLVKLH